MIKPATYVRQEVMILSLGQDVQCLEFYSAIILLFIIYVCFTTAHFYVVFTNFITPVNNT